MLFEDRVKAVIELASLSTFTASHLAFLEQLTSSIGIVLNSIEATMQTEALLKQSQQLAAELQTQQKELQQTNEQLAQKAQQLAEQNSEVERKNQEIEQARRALEEKARELALTSKYKSEFLANMSHELRTPLNSILVLGQQLAENPDGNLTGRQVEFARTIHGAGTDLLNLISDILDLSKIESGTVSVEAEELFFGSLLEAVARPFRHEAENRRLSFEVKSDPKLGRSLVTDPRRLQQVLKNLLSNAFKFTEQGGVRLTVSRAQSGWSLDHPILSGAGSVVAFEVSDTGIGIPGEKQRIIFEAFQQADAGTSRKYGGTGLGLAISRELASLLGGEIQLRSTPGKGSTFTLFVPQTYVGPAAAPLAERQRTSSASAPAYLAAPVVSEQDIRHRRRPPNLAAGRQHSAHRRRRPALCPRPRRSLPRQRIQGPLRHDVAPRLSPWPASSIPLPFHSTSSCPTCSAGPSSITSRQIRAPGTSRFRCSPSTKTATTGSPAAPSPSSPNPPPPKAWKPPSPASATSRSPAANACWSSKTIPPSSSAFANSSATTTSTSTSPIHGAAALETLEPGRLRLRRARPAPAGHERVRSSGPSARKRQSSGTCPWSSSPAANSVAEEDARLHMLARSVVVKDVESPERLLDETALFLHRVVADLPADKQRMLDRLHQSDEALFGRKVLIVDDDVRNIFALSSVLERRGMTVLTAGTGREAIATIESTPDLAIVLMDIMMPEMDGYETMQVIRQNASLRRLPIIALTAKAMKGDREKCLEAGASEYLAKPVNTEQLLSALRMWLHR